MTAAASPTQDQVPAMIHGWTLMRIEWLRRRLREADPAGAAAEDMEELSRALADSGSAAGPLLADPRVGRWCAVVSNLLDRDAARLLPDGHFSAACREAQALTLAARLLLAQAGPAADMPPMPVRCDRAGEIRLLGTRLVLRCGLASAGSQITVGILRGQPAAPGVPDAELAVEPTPLSGLVVPDGDPVAVATCGSDPVLSAPWPMIAVERGERPPHAAARPGIAEVPVTASPAWRAAHVAAAAAHLRSVALGEVSPADWADGLPPDIADVADAGHVSRLLELFERSAVQGSAAQSKERDEIADILGRMAGWLGGAGRLSDQGALIRDRLADHGFRPGRRVRASQRNTTTSIVWRTQWQSAGGRFREPLPGAGRRALPGADLSGLLKQLGSPDDVPVNTLADEQARADPTIDHLSLMHAREPERFAELAGQIERLPLPLSVAGQLLTGHVAYIRERFDLAVAAYAELLGQLPEDIDLWRDFAFALRHLGEVRLNEVAIFRLKDVVERASACHLELGSLDGVRAEPDGWQSAAIPVRLHVGLLEWVGHDPDYR